jgi:hypothetical protein
MTFNHRYPPFDNPAIRRALLGAVDQAEAMSAIAGSDRNNWRDDVGLFGTGSPFATDVGIEVLRSPRDYAAVKRALAEAGYKGEKIVVMAPTDVRELGDLTRTGAEQLRRPGMNVDLLEIDFANVVRRRNNQGPPDKISHNMFCTLIDRSLTPPGRSSGPPSSTATGRTSAIRPPARYRLSATLKSHSWPTPVDGRAGQGADIRAGFRHMPVAGSRQCIEQRPCVFEIGRLEAFGEPAVDRCEEVAGFGVAALVAAESGEARRGTQLPRFRLLLARRFDRVSVALFCLVFLGGGRGQQQVTFNPMQLRGPPLFAF